MKPKAKFIDTPAGKFEAPLHPGFLKKLERCETKEDLFELVESGSFTDPDAFAEVHARGLYQEYRDWKSDDDRTPMEKFGEAMLGD